MKQRINTLFSVVSQNFIRGHKQYIVAYPFGLHLDQEMSRIYHNQALANLTVDNVSIKTKWDDVLQYTKDGPGVIMEAIIRGKARYCLTDTDQKKVRYFVFQLEPLRAHRRKYESSGKEIEPNFSLTTKVSTGFLNSSYKTEAKGNSDRLSKDELSSLVSRPELRAAGAKHAILGCVSGWMEEAELDKMELEIGDTVRVKTRGNSPFLLSIAKLEGESSTVSNYAGGEAVGASWTDKIMNIKSTTQDKTMDDNEVGDDEWDD